MKIVFRTDASVQIGTGHVMRCLVLARALRESGAHCLFICREHAGNLNSTIEKAGFEVLSLPPSSVSAAEQDGASTGALRHSYWLGTSWETDAEECKSVLSTEPADWIVVDHYALDIYWERELKRYCKRLLVIDDLADRSHECDRLLDQNLVKNYKDRYKNLIPKVCGKMLGPKFSLIDPEFAERQKDAPPKKGKIQRILVYFGGIDFSNMIATTLAAIESLDPSDMHVDVVLGDSSPNYQEIRSLIEGFDHVQLHSNLPGLVPLIAESDLSVGGCGVTTWERCCLGLPTLVVSVADNQKPIAEALSDFGYIKWLGHCDEVSESTIAKSLSPLMRDGLDESWSVNCRNLVDGLGTDRVRTVLMAAGGLSLHTRLARPNDEKLFLDWANDPVVRENSFNSEPIDKNTHSQWFKSKLEDPERCRLYVLESENGHPVGQVRYDLVEGNWEIDYSVDALFRGYGLGRQVLEKSLSALKGDFNNPRVIGIVKQDNLVSKRIFESLAFSPVACEHDLRYQRSL